MSGSGSKLIIGLAGGIGSGKSTVARFLSELGVAVIDSDHLSHEELSDPEVVSRIVQWYGPSVQDPGGGICREALAGIIFGDPQERRRVEQLLHPRVARRRQLLMEAHASDPGVVAIAIDSPLLYEAGLEDICDAVIFVDAPREQRLQRVAASRGWSPEELDRREKRQTSLDFKRAKADHIIVNNSVPDDLRSRVEATLSKILKAAPDDRPG